MATLKQRIKDLVDVLSLKLNILYAKIETRALKTTEVVAGTGLSGGGDLSSDKTINVNFGTGANSVAMGNHQHSNYIDITSIQDVNSTKTFLKKQVFNDIIQNQLALGTSAGNHLQKYTNIKSYVSRYSTVLGELRVEIPIATATMWTLKIEIFEYSSAIISNTRTTELIITGYTTSNVHRSVICNNPDRIKEVRYGRNTANDRSVIYIKPASDFIYPRAYIKELLTYHNASSGVDDSANYVIDIVTTDDDFVLNGTILNSEFLRDSYYMPYKPFGTSVDTVAQGNDERINNGQTAFGWGDSATKGYAIASNVYTKAQALENFVGRYGVQDVFSTKTFIESPIVPIPTLGGHAVNKQYTDSKYVISKTLDWTDISHNLPANFVNVVLRYKTKNGIYTLDFSWENDGSGTGSNNTEFEIALLPNIDSSLLVNIDLNIFTDNVAVRSFSRLKLKSTGEDGEDVSLVVETTNFASSAESAKTRATLPIAKQ